MNVLKASPKISNPTNRHDTQLNLFDIKGILAQKCCCADLGSVLDPLTGWFPKDVVKQEF